MLDFISSLSIFNEHLLLFRTTMYSFGWIILLVSTITLIQRLREIKNKINDYLFAKFIFLTLIGWLTTMWSLGAVCTIFAYTNPKIGTMVTVPVFIIWCITMVVIFWIASRWMKEAIHHYNKMGKLNTEIQAANIKLKQLDQLKTEFITIATHQLRTPLTEIKWALNMLSSESYGKVDAQQKKVLKGANESNEKIIEIINDLLSAEKSGGINWGYKFNKESIEKIIEDVLKNFNPIAQRKDLGLHFNEPVGSIPKITLDVMKINTVIGILVENAIHYSPQGKDIEVGVKNKGEYIEVVVEDSGIGISDIDKEKVFSKFFRGDNAVKVVTNGTGIGLNIAKNIISVHGGKIWFEQKESGGTKFFFTIPFRNEI